jgi:endo-1,4-beta-xylanase
MMTTTAVSTLHVAFALGAAMVLCGIARAAVPDTPPQESPHPASVHLWPNGAPGFESRKDEPEKLAWREEPENNIVFPTLFNIHNPSITPFLPEKSIATGAAVIVAPGGGNMFVTIDREGYDLGKWLAANGIAAFVLKYRLSNDNAVPRGESPYKADVHALQDGQRAMRLVRSRAAEWGVDPKRVGFLGFSAGGSLAGLLALHNDAGDPKATDPVERFSSRPDFNGFIYGGPYRVPEFTKDMAPSFLMCAYDDNGNANNLANLFIKLRAAGVPAELHIFGAGGHGFGVRSDRGLAEETWPARFRDWMKDIGMLAPKKP